MEFGGINILAAGVAGVAGMVVGAVWYMVFSKPWLKATGLKQEATNPTPGLMVNALICQLLMAWVLAGLIGHLGEGQVTLRNGLISAAFVWVGFVLTTQLVNHRFQGRPWMLSFIDCGHWLLVLLLQGAIIGLMGV